MKQNVSFGALYGWINKGNCVIFFSLLKYQLFCANVTGRGPD